MDEATPCIVDAPLPVAVDFNALKSLGIDQLKSLVGETWSNFNESDPGVTILDQLCYALTELGYCAEFPIEDVLTDKDGKIRYDGQFFAPQEILTCSPVTIDDYRRLVHDRIAGVEAIYIAAEFIRLDSADGGTLPSGRYSTYLHFSPSADVDSTQLRTQVHSLLNAHRNLGEMFTEPRLLDRRRITLSGSLNLVSGADITQVQSRIIQVLKAYTVPPVLHRGYQELRGQGIPADEIFNGPNLGHGWIGGADALPAKTQRINLFELSALLAAVEGVAQVQGLGLTENGVSLEVSEIDAGQIVDLEPLALTLTRNTVLQPLEARQEAADYLSGMREQHQAASVEAAVNPYPPLPYGRYRNIEDYYSIQNTFPDTYGIGPNSLQSDLPDPRVASSRQLKGYLLVFDQLLANQFSQLAHVGELFSFKSSAAARLVYGNESVGLTYPPFEATYHCQALYNVPDVMPLLRGNAAFHFQMDPQEPDKLVERDAWKRFQQQPSNAYLHGLRGMMEGPDVAQSRRDRMLSHLMARHGDQAGLYDDMIKIGHWYGSDARTRSVVKSIWLENYPLLSYHRTCAFNPWRARPLQVLPEKDQTRRYPPFAGPPRVDGQLNEALIQQNARLKPADLVNFSAFELKSGILLGLAEHLLAICGKLAVLLENPGFQDWLRAPPANNASYALPGSDISIVLLGAQHWLYEGKQQLLHISSSTMESVSAQDYRLHLDQLQWLATQRKGFVLIEHPLLLADGQQGTPAWYLSASLVFPDYLSLVMQDGFKTFIQTLIDQHWPAHVGVNCLTMSQVTLRALIQQFVTWHNLMSDPASERRNAAAQALAKLLKLPAAKEAGNAS
ncbi:hypothetical protein [Pseudomonas sp. MWU13-2105]|uniref:hypothetical protein n=1 Tax=Pseudomonas sp. MWU13-2105 TaxID=2935074 RepID=UPI00200E61B2|nr:hypothetical protein [Pseudomonas sp. MWU13-2105]